MVTFCYLMLVTILHWGIPPSLSSSNLSLVFSLLDLFLNLCESSYWGIPPLALFYWGIPPSLGLRHLVLISWSFDPFVDTSESFIGAYLLFIEFTIPITFLGFSWAFLVVDHIPCFLFLIQVFLFANRILFPLPSSYLGNPPTVSLSRHSPTFISFRASP